MTRTMQAFFSFCGLRGGRREDQEDHEIRVACLLCSKGYCCARYAARQGVCMGARLTRWREGRLKCV